LSEILSLLEEVTLVAPIDEDHNYNNKIRLMTVHNAKGLEFENVFIVGLEEGLFPHANSIDEEDFEEERRLFYVAITRAKTNLVISYCQKRNMFGMENYQEPSQFLMELPVEISNNNYFDKYQNNDNKTTKFSVGNMVRHKDYGNGKIIMLKYVKGKNLVMVDFYDHSIKEFILEYTDLELIT
jgi:DNA helicase-2/ATP-dependent DNA helicase PcrA